MGDSCLLSSLPWRKTFSDYTFNRNNEEKKETNNNSPGYLWLSCASLGTWELPALSRIVVSSRRYRNLISRGANSLRPSLGCTCFRLDQLLASWFEWRCAARQSCIDVSAWQALDIQTRFSINVYVHRGRKHSLRQGLILAASLSLYFHSSLLHTADTIGCSIDAHDRHPF